MAFQSVISLPFVSSRKSRSSWGTCLRSTRSKKGRGATLPGRASPLTTSSATGKALWGNVNLSKRLLLVSTCSWASKKTPAFYLNLQVFPEPAEDWFQWRFFTEQLQETQAEFLQVPNHVHWWWHQCHGFYIQCPVSNALTKIVKDFCMDHTIQLYIAKNLLLHQTRKFLIKKCTSKFFGQITLQ